MKNYLKNNTFEYTSSNPNVDRAVLFYYYKNTSVSTNSGSFSRSSVVNHSKQYFNRIQNIEQIHSKFQHVNIEHMDFEDLINKYDSEYTFFYLDPPYIQRGHYYSGGFTHDDHIRLINKLNNIKGKYMLSGYNSSVYENLLNYKSKYEFFRTQFCHVGDSKRKQASEVIWLNYVVSDSVLQQSEYYITDSLDEN